MSKTDNHSLNDRSFLPYRIKTIPPEEQIRLSYEYYLWANTRRSVREFSEKPVDRKVIENIIATASTSPSGAHKQPWMFCAISDPAIKKAIREGAEKEEFENYHSRMSEDWLEDLKPFRTDWHKPFLEMAPWLIVVFRKIYDRDETGQKRNNYYVTESTGLACGMLLMAIHHAGLAALTHTPSPMNFLCSILKRPENEKPFLLIPTGYAPENCKVPDIKRKSLNEISDFYTG